MAFLDTISAEDLCATSFADLAAMGAIDSGVDITIELEQFAIASQLLPFTAHGHIFAAVGSSTIPEEMQLAWGWPEEAVPWDPATAAGIIIQSSVADSFLGQTTPVWEGSTSASSSLDAQLNAAQLTVTATSDASSALTIHEFTASSNATTTVTSVLTNSVPLTASCVVTTIAAIDGINLGLTASTSVTSTVGPAGITLSTFTQLPSVTSSATTTLTAEGLTLSLGLTPSEVISLNTSASALLSVSSTINTEYYDYDTGLAVNHYGTRGAVAHHDTAVAVERI